MPTCCHVRMQSGPLCGSKSDGALCRDIDKLHSAATVLTEYSGIPAAIQVRYLYRNWVPAADKGVCYRLFHPAYGVPCSRCCR